MEEIIGTISEHASLVQYIGGTTSTATVTVTNNKIYADIVDAPKDGNAYVRKDGAWVKLSDIINS